MRPVRPTVSLSVAILALALSLGGVSYAVGKIDTRNIKKAAVTAAKIKSGAVTATKIRDGAVDSTTVLNNSLTGLDIDETTLRRSGPGETVTIAGLEFTPRDSADERLSKGYGDTYRASVGTSWFAAPLHLPQSSVIKAVKFYLLDNTRTGTFGLSLARYEIATGELIDLRFQFNATVDGPAIVEVDNTPVLSQELIVDNTKYAYFVLANPDAANQALAIYGAKVRYSLLPADLVAAQAAPARPGAQRSAE